MQDCYIASGPATWHASNRGQVVILGARHKAENQKAESQMAEKSKGRKSIGRKINRQKIERQNIERQKIERQKLLLLLLCISISLRVDDQTHTGHVLRNAPLYS